LADFYIKAIASYLENYKHDNFELIDNLESVTFTKSVMTNLDSMYLNL